MVIGREVWWRREGEWVKVFLCLRLCCCRAPSPLLPQRCCSPSCARTPCRAAAALSPLSAAVTSLSTAGPDCSYRSMEYVCQTECDGRRRPWQKLARTAPRRSLPDLVTWLGGGGRGRIVVGWLPLTILPPRRSAVAPFLLPKIIDRPEKMAE